MTHFFVMSLSCHAGSDVIGLLGMAGPGSLVNALMGVNSAFNTSERRVAVLVNWGETRDTLPPEPQFLA